MKIIIAIDEVVIIMMTLASPIPPLSIAPGRTWKQSAPRIINVKRTIRWADIFTSFSLLRSAPRLNKIIPKKKGISAVTELVSI